MMYKKKKRFRKRSIFARLRMPQPELDAYYEAYRKDLHQRGIGIRGLWWRKWLHPIMLCGVKSERWLRRETLEVLHDKRIATKRPIIFAATHIGGHDIERCFEVIKEHAYLFLGDPREVYRNFNGVVLSLNGVICLETRSKTDRKIAKENAIELLRKGGNILIYPEGVWNVSENLLVNPLYMGTASMAVKTGADIVPIAIEQYRKKWYVNIGRNISCSSAIDITKLTEMLRDELAELKWEILQRNGLVSYKEITQKDRDGWINTIFEKTNYSYTLSDVLETEKKTEEAIAFDEVCKSIQRIIPSSKNAFLFRNNIFQSRDVQSK